MDTINYINFLLFLIIFSVRAFIGIDVKKWSSWLYGAYAFLTGYLFSFTRAEAEISSRLLLGAIFSFAMMYIGSFVYIHRQHYK